MGGPRDGLTMDDTDLSEQIAKLEADIERHAETIERCRKISLASRAAIVLGAVVGTAVLLGLLTFDATALIGAMAAVIGGTVVFGSNASTWAQAEAALRAAEALRADLIKQISFRVIPGGRSNGSGLGQIGDRSSYH
jgi:hypothetical protein